MSTAIKADGVDAELLEAVQKMHSRGFTSGEMAALLVTTAHAVLRIDNPHTSREKLVYLAGRISGLATVVGSDEPRH
jgi:hypothetical protein